MALNIVPEARGVPGACAASGTVHGPFVDCRRVLLGPRSHVYLAISYLRSIATSPEFDMVNGSRYRAKVTEVSRLKERIAELESLLRRSERDVFAAVTARTLEGMEGRCVEDDWTPEQRELHENATGLLEVK